MFFIIKTTTKLIKHKYVVITKNVARLWLKRNNANWAPLEAGYQPKQVESWQNLRRVLDAPRRNQLSRGTFRMILPPPNVTGNLHLGHALMATVQDIICRHRRQMGYDIEWIPGTDHAGIATQVVVEKKLRKDRQLGRHEIGRAQFLKEVLKWKEEKAESILEDLRSLGCILNWDKEYFTMDDRRAAAVNAAFVQLFEQGLIKRQKSLVNWSCNLESAISDMEVETCELKGATKVAVPGYSDGIIFGRIYDISYRVCNTDEFITVSTTRPETLLGDVAVAVHPEDLRYSKYRNFEEVSLWHPFRLEPIPLIFDLSVDRDFGTGAVKITPAHDKKDFDIARRHLLEAITVFTDRGAITDNFEGFKGLPRFEARECILSALAEMKLLGSIRDHAMSLPICSRSNDIIEYMLRDQWFLHCQPMADAAMAEVRSGRLQIIPNNFELDWYRWLENCHDWCISRQLWWGHQVPAYYATDESGTSCWVAAVNDEDALSKVHEKLMGKINKIERDTDVLDTWFSSALLPFSAFNWPATEYKKHYPLDLLETGHDILFFWVARMTMLGLQLTGEVPFKKILLNGILCDAHGRKMSKSLGNVVTPKQVIQGTSLKSMQATIKYSHDSGIVSSEERKKSLDGLQKMFPNGIQECGTDALRFTLCSHNIQNHFINFDVSECHTNKLFLNKIWQAVRYTLGAAERLKVPLHEIESMNNVELSKWDQWILGRLAETLTICAISFDNYNFHAATAAFKTFFYNNLCDIYLETTKANVVGASPRGYIHCATLATCLSWGLQGMSPITPFIAAELLKHLPQNIHLNLNRFHNKALSDEIGTVLNVCQSVRQLKSRYSISKKHEPKVHLFAKTTEAYKTLEPHLSEVQALTLTNGATLSHASLEKNNAFKFSSTAGHLFSFGLSTNELFNTTNHAVSKGMTSNEKKLEKLMAELARYRARVDNEGFRKNASKEVQEKHKEKIQKLEVEIGNIKEMSS